MPAPVTFVADAPDGEAPASFQPDAPQSFVADPTPASSPIALKGFTTPDDGTGFENPPIIPQQGRQLAKYTTPADALTAKYSGPKYPQSPAAQSQLFQAASAINAPKLPVSGAAGQVTTAAFSPPKPFTDMVEIGRGIIQNNKDTTLAMRALAKKHGIDPDSVARLPALWEHYLHGATEAGIDLGLSFTSPAGLLTMGFGALPAKVQKAASLGFSAQMLSQFPEQTQALIDEENKPDAEKDHAKIAQLYLGALTSGGFGVAAGGHGISRDQPVAPPKPSRLPPAAIAKPPAETFSEFGSDQAEPPIVDAAGQPADITKPVAEVPNLPTQPATFVADPPPSNNPPIQQSDLAAGADSPLPESIDTLNHQLDALRAGQRQAVLFTPGEAVPKWAQDSDQFSTHETPAGTFLYDAAELTKDQLDQHVKNNTVGRVLGYGIDAKPAEADTIGAVTVRDAKGVEKQSVLTDQANLASVMQAAQKVAGEGDSIRLESPAEVLTARTKANETAPTLTSERARMAKENVDAMAALRAAKIDADGKVSGVMTDDQKYTAALELLKSKAKQSNEDRKSESYTPGDSLFAAGIDPLLSLAKAQGVRSELQIAGTGSNYLLLEVPTDFNAAGEPANFETRKFRIANHDASVFREKQFGRNTSERILGENRTDQEKAGEWLAEKIVEAADDAYGNQPKTHPWNTEFDYWLENENASPKAGVRKSETLQDWNQGKASDYVPDTANRPGEPIKPQPEQSVKSSIGERPPDILDWIADNFKRGVRTTSREDYADHVTAATGKSRELLSHTKGERADRVLKEMHDQGLFPRIETEDQLYEAMNRAAGARKQFTKPGKSAVGSRQSAISDNNAPDVAPDVIENWFDDAIAATDLNRGSTLEGVTGAPVWITKAAANGALRAAKLAYTTTRDLAKAIAAGIEHLRSLGLKNFDETQANTWLKDTLGERATGQRALESPTLSPEVKDAITEFIYERRPLATDKQIATELLNQLGVADAIKLVQAPPADLPGPVRVLLSGTLLEHLAGIERQNKEMNPPAAREAIAQQGLVADALMAQATDPAQTLRAMQEVVKASPDAQVARARKEIEKGNSDVVDRKRAEIEQVRTAIEEGREEGITAVKQDPAVNGAARAAVDENILDQAGTIGTPIHQGIVMELAKPWSDSPEILNHAREQVRAKANDLLNKAPRPAGFTPAQHLRQILDDLAKRAADIFAGHIQGAEPGISIVDKLQQRLGLDRPSAQKLATQLSKEWDRQLEAAKKALPARLAMQRAKQLAGISKPDSKDTAVDKLLRAELRAQNLKLGDILKRASGDRTATGKHIADRIVDASGLTGDKADALRLKLQQRYDDLVREAQERKLTAIEKRSGVKISRPVRSAFDKLVELDRLGALSNTKFYETVKAALKLKQLTAEDAKRLRDLIQIAQDAPEGWQRTRAQAKVLTAIEELKGEMAWHDVPMSLWYANIFSGPMTHAANLIGNSFKAMEVLGMETLSHPTATPTILKAFARGAESGVLEAASVLRTGKLEGTRMLKAEPARPLEWRIEKGGWQKVYLPWAAVGRALAAEDVLPFKAHEEIKWSLLARRVARREGLAGAQLSKRVDDLLHNTEAEWSSAKVQAGAEGLTGLNFYRRAHEIIEQRREVSMPGTTEIARQYGLTHTFNAEPYGIAGSIAEVLNTMNRKLVVTRFAVPVVRIMANLTNEGLAYFPPVGLARLLIAAKTRKLDGLEISENDTWRYHIARAAVGTALFAALATIGANSLDSEDPALAIYGQGPRTKTQRDLLKSAGWKPNSIKIGGRYYSYQETQAAIPLNILGNYFDAIRYKHLSQEDAVTRTAYALQQVGHTVLDQRMLSGVADLLDILSTDNAGQTDKQLGDFFARTGSSFIVPNAVRWIDQVFDPAVYQASDVKGQLLLQTPFARSVNQPAINAFGQPIERNATDRFTTVEKPDPLVSVLAHKNAWISMPNLDAQIVGDRAKGPDYYRPMTPEEYYQWIATSGPMIRERLQDHLDDIRELDEDHAKGYVQRIVNQERQKAKNQLGFLP